VSFSQKIGEFTGFYSFLALPFLPLPFKHLLPVNGKGKYQPVTVYRR